MKKDLFHGAIIVACVGAIFWVRLTHPEMTETQLLVNYAPLWLAIVVIAFLILRSK